jgi:hypothetical protein
MHFEDLDISFGEIIAFFDGICLDASTERSRTRKTPSNSVKASLLRCTRRALYFLLIPSVKARYGNSYWKDPKSIHSYYWSLILGTSEKTQYRKFPPEEPGVPFVRPKMTSLIDNTASVKVSNACFDCWPLWALESMIRLIPKTAHLVAQVGQKRFQKEESPAGISIQADGTSQFPENGFPFAELVQELYSQIKENEY